MNLSSVLCRVILLPLLFACSKKVENPVVPPSSNIAFSASPVDLQGIHARFAKDIAYDSKARTQFDIWLPASNTPTGLVMYVHGGGFTSVTKILYIQFKPAVLGISQQTFATYFKTILHLPRFVIRISIIQGKQRVLKSQCQM